MHRVDHPVSWTMPIAHVASMLERSARSRRDRVRGGIRTASCASRSD